MRADEGPAGDDSRGAPQIDDAPATGRTSTRQDSEAAPERPAQRWARERLNAYIARLASLDFDDDDLDDRPACSGWHYPAPCDYWAVCTSMSLGMVQRELAGAEHPWRWAA